MIDGFLISIIFRVQLDRMLIQSHVMGDFKEHLDTFLNNLISIHVPHYLRFSECSISVMFLRIVADMKVSEIKYQEIINQLKAFSSQRQLPMYMRKRLEKYYFYRFRNNFFKESEIKRRLSGEFDER